MEESKADIAVPLDWPSINTKRLKLKYPNPMLANTTVLLQTDRVYTHVHIANLLKQLGFTVEEIADGQTK